MKPELSIVIIGGNIIENEKELARFLTIFSQIKGAKILVHGGGKKATAMADKLGGNLKLPPNFGKFAIKCVS